MASSREVAALRRSAARAAIYHFLDKPARFGWQDDAPQCAVILAQHGDMADEIRQWLTAA
jgi:hypothetical protein